MNRVVLVAALLALASFSALACGGSADIDAIDRDHAGTTQEANSITQQPIITPPSNTIGTGWNVPLPPVGGTGGNPCLACHANGDVSGMAAPASHFAKPTLYIP